MSLGRASCLELSDIALGYAGHLEAFLRHNNFSARGLAEPSTHDQQPNEGCKSVATGSTRMHITTNLSAHQQTSK